MSLAFTLIAALMAAAALACLLLPLLRRGQPRPPLPLALVLCVALPLGALGLYAWIGTPAALNPAASRAPEMDLATAVSKLRARLKTTPDDAEGWLLLGRAYQAMQQDTKAVAALHQALQLNPDDPDIMVAYVEAASLHSADHRIGDDLRALLHKALAAQPDNQRGLWLLGISDFQRGDHAAAAADWRRLLPLLPPGSKVAAAVKTQIGRAEQAAGMAPAASVAAAASAATVATAPAAAASAGAAIQVRVSLAPALRKTVAGGETVFVFARALDGPPMPLAVARLQASQLPATVTLTDAMAMTPRLRLSMFPRVRVNARISASGTALPQPGDLQATAAEVAVRGAAPVNLSIDHRIATDAADGPGSGAAR
ncbi:MAG TPA: tetratricopeptide repeat protein [Rhodanobacteraceae bacterium]|nr:tetratricopeptide repeat protein [Rhodanobacteraceae bacterium]